MRVKTENEVETQKNTSGHMRPHALRAKVSGRRFVPRKTDFEKKATVLQSWERRETSVFAG